MSTSVLLERCESDMVLRTILITKALHTLSGSLYSGDNKHYLELIQYSFASFHLFYQGWGIIYKWNIRMNTNLFCLYSLYRTIHQYWKLQWSNSFHLTSVNLWLCSLHKHQSNLFYDYQFHLELIHQYWLVVFHHLAIKRTTEQHIIFTVCCFNCYAEQ
jgi:hypothetical protein